MLPFCFQVWFWRFRSDYADEVHRRQAEADIWAGQLEKIRADHGKMMTSAKHAIGLWSEVVLTALVSSIIWLFSIFMPQQFL